MSLIAETFHRNLKTEIHYAEWCANRGSIKSVGSSTRRRWFREKNAFLNDILLPITDGALDHKLIFFTNKAWFYLRGCINAQNNSYWSSANPRQTSEVTFTIMRLVCGVALRLHEQQGRIFKTLVYEQKVDILSIHCVSKSFTQLTYFQKCRCVSTMRGIITKTRDCYFSADGGGRSGSTDRRQAS